MIEYDVHHWRNHFFDIRGSMVREILYRVLSCLVVATAVTYVDRTYMRLGISDKAHGLVGVALGLLLVFRTNAAYDRFWEGRKLWGAMVNSSRNLARGAVVLLGERPALVRRLLLLTTAFAYATMQRLREQPGLGAFNNGFSEGLDAADRSIPAELAGAHHLPMAIAVRLSATLKEARDAGLLGEYQHIALDQNIQSLIDCLGGCERIHRTPLPFAYVVHLRRALIIYCYSLPLILLPVFGWATIVVTLLLSYVLLGIEEIGVEISDPFGTDDNDLPLERLCATIETDLRAQLLPSLRSCNAERPWPSTSFCTDTKTS